MIVEDNLRLFEKVTKDEVVEIFSSFKRDKSPSLIGWTIEFFLNFFYLVGNNLRRVIKEVRSISMVLDAINSTCIGLDPKTNKPTSFDEFRLISLCKFLYKIIAKVLAIMLNWLSLRFYTQNSLYFFLVDRYMKY